MTLLFVSMDYQHDWGTKLYLQSWKNTNRVYLLHSDVRRMQGEQMDTDEIKEHIRRTIDESEAVLVIAGEGVNTPSPDAELIGAWNWQHFGLEYALRCNKPMRCMKLHAGCPVPTPLVGHPDLRWPVINGMEYNAILDEISRQTIFSSEHWAGSVHQFMFAASAMA